MFASRLSSSQLSKNDAFPALKEKARSTLYLRFSPMRFEIGNNQNNW
jgi:hypothetical protein